MLRAVTLAIVATVPALAGTAGAAAETFKIDLYAGKPASSPAHSYKTATCEPVGIPQLAIIQAPKHGKLSGVQATVRVESKDACNGRKIPGLNITYLPSSGYLGPDDFAYDVIYPSGDSSRYSYSVTIVPAPKPTGGKAKPQPQSAPPPTGGGVAPPPPPLSGGHESTD